MKLPIKNKHEARFDFCLKKTEVFHTAIIGKTSEGMSLAGNRVVFVQPQTGKLSNKEKLDGYQSKLFQEPKSN